MRFRRFLLPSLLFSLLVVSPSAQSAAAKGGISSIQPDALKEWLTYIASDELQGRATYSEGLGLAAGYISTHLAQWGVKPAGDNGTYLQVVKVVGVRSTSRASITVDVNGQSRTFKDNEGILFPKNMGGTQTITGDDVQFVGYGLTLPSGQQDDYAKTNPKGKVVVWLGPQGPKTSETGLFRLLGSTARNRSAIEKGAIAVIGPQMSGGGGRGRATAATSTATTAPAAGATAAAPAAGRGRGGAVDDGDFTTVQRYEDKVPPAVTAQDEFFDFLFSGSDVKYAELKQMAADQQPLPQFALKGVKITFNVDADYSVVRTRLTHNVVGIVEGSDPKLKDTYVVYGAHYDHTGYREGLPGAGRGGQAPANAEDRINNGADDDGSGTVAIMSIARAFALGPRPKRSVLFVWHAGEEVGLLGSRYNADHPVVPIEKMAAQINMDMVGRNRDNDPKQANTVLVVGSDRISTELHNINEDANASLPKPMALDYEMNDPADTESIYTRSDHYSYAAKGVPIIFFFTGLHPDYHMASDSVDKILFDKIQRVAQLAYETGRRVANLDHFPVRDNKGPRVGKTVKGKIK
ncbi:MAG TPA: M28 family peptidase [Vicinamibacterales bacterium]|nr:M28 family peptidase [Vicinamibacterales bacterium]